MISEVVDVGVVIGEMAGLVSAEGIALKLPVKSREAEIPGG